MIDLDNLCDSLKKKILSYLYPQCKSDKNSLGGQINTLSYAYRDSPIHNLSLTSRAWRDATDKFISEFSCEISQEDFEQAFAASIFKEDFIVFNLLKQMKEAREDTDHPLSIQHLWIRKADQSMFRMDEEDLDDYLENYEDCEEYTGGKSMWYFAIEKNWYSLANFLFDDIILKASNFLDLGHLLEINVTPLTRALINLTDGINAAETIAKKILRYGSRFPMGQEHWRLEEFQGLQYHYGTPLQDLILEMERNLLDDIREEDEESLKNELEQIKSENEELKTENEKLRIKLSKYKKRKIEKISGEKEKVYQENKRQKFSL